MLTPSNNMLPDPSSRHSLLFQIQTLLQFQTQTQIPDTDLSFRHGPYLDTGPCSRHRPFFTLVPDTNLRPRQRPQVQKQTLVPETDPFSRHRPQFQAQTLVYPHSRHKPQVKTQTLGPDIDLSSTHRLQFRTWTLVYLTVVLEKDPSSRHRPQFQTQSHREVGVCGQYFHCCSKTQYGSSFSVKKEEEYWCWGKVFRLSLSCGRSVCLFSRFCV